MQTFHTPLTGIYRQVDRLTVWLWPLLLLAMRLFVAKVFLLSGLTKIQNWDVTLFLFQEEYHVPVLAPWLAAIMGTAGELGFSVLLILGVFGRFSAFGMLLVNIMAVLSYQVVRDDPALLGMHIHWGFMLAVLALTGAGKLSVDGLLLSRWLPSGGVAVRR
ncbi:DoxX family protein [Pokkaliibacter sp. CJK22405]|uniref:DoxX family protein n=1 Tax=Pokkaliibacter sp. CJK22405 TaxID=3384615 RepID=UPI003984AC21